MITWHDMIFIYSSVYYFVEYLFIILKPRFWVVFWHWLSFSSTFYSTSTSTLSIYYSILISPPHSPSSPFHTLQPLNLILPSSFPSQQHPNLSEQKQSQWWEVCKSFGPRCKVWRWEVCFHTWKSFPIGTTI